MFKFFVPSQGFHPNAVEAVSFRLKPWFIRKNLVSFATDKSTRSVHNYKSWLAKYSAKDGGCTAMVSLISDEYPVHTLKLDINEAALKIK